MAELKADELLPGEVPVDELEGGDKAVHEEKTTVSPEGVVKRTIHAEAAKDPEDVPEPAPVKNALDKVAEVLKPETVTGALATGVSKGATLGFGDELYGLANADSDADAKLLGNVRALDEQKQKDADALVEAARHGTDALKAEHDRQVSSAAPQIPGVTSQALKREGQPTISVSREAETAPADEAPDAPDVAQAYRNARDSMREQYGAAEKAHPTAFNVGEFAGGMAVPLPGPGKAKGIAKAVKYGISGAGVGGVNALGNSEADLTKGEPGAFGQAAIDTGMGAGGGLLLGGALGYGASKLDPALERFAERRAFKALNPYMKTIRENLGGKLGRDPTDGELMAEMQRLGRRVLDEGIIPESLFGRFAGVKELGERTTPLRKEAGVLKGAFDQHVSSQLGPNAGSRGALATQLENAAHDARLSGDQDIARALESEAADVRQTVIDRAAAGHPDPAAMTFEEMEKYKTMLQNKAKYGLEFGKRGGPVEEAKRSIARYAKEQSERALESKLGPDELATHQALKNRFGDLKKIENIAKYGNQMDFRNNVVGPGDKAAGMTGAIVAGAHAANPMMAIPAAAAASAAHHLINKRGAAAIARTADTMANSTSPYLAPAVQQAQEKAKALFRDDEEQPQPWQALRGGR